MKSANNDSKNKTTIKPSTFPSGLQNGWFSETDSLLPGQKFSLALQGLSSQKAILFSDQSDFQSIFVFQSAEHGNVLCLDGVIQLTERDEFSFHEMIAHLPLFSHPDPRNVLIVGGGDGGVLREVCKHDGVQTITMIEIDPMVITVAKQFFSTTTATSFDDKRLTIVHEDAAEFLRRVNSSNHENNDEKGKYDVIIIDSSEPFGPAESLFTPSFYDQINEALRQGGIVCAQGECIWMQLDYVVDVFACCGDIFDFVDYATTMVPTYPCGQMGFLLAGKGRPTCRTPVRKPSQTLQNSLKWYNPAVHRASFVLPHFVERKLTPLRPSQYSEDTIYYPEKDDDYFDEEKDCFLGCTIV